MGREEGFLPYTAVHALAFENVAMPFVCLHLCPPIELPLSQRARMGEEIFPETYVEETFDPAFQILETPLRP
jgi:hypothetical protein